MAALGGLGTAARWLGGFVEERRRGSGRFIIEGRQWSDEGQVVTAGERRGEP